MNCFSIEPGLEFQQIAEKNLQIGCIAQAGFFAGAAFNTGKIVRTEIRKLQDPLTQFPDKTYLHILMIAHDDPTLLWRSLKWHGRSDPWFPAAAGSTAEAAAWLPPVWYSHWPDRDS